MQKRIGVVSIIVEDLKNAENVNSILHDFSKIIIGRMGLPNKDYGVSIISVVVDGTNDQISAMTGRLGKIENVTVKTALAKMKES